MALAFDNVTSSKTTSATTSLTFAHTCAAGQPVLVVCVQVQGTSGIVDPTGVTYNGVAMTKATSLSQGTSRSASIWYLANPTTGSSQNVVITPFVAQWVIGSALSFTGADTSSPLGAVNSANGTNTAPTVSVTTTVANSYIISSFYLNDNAQTTTVTAPTVQQSRDNNTDGEAGLSGTRLTTTIGSYSTDWTLGGSSVWILANMELKPGAAPTVNSNFFTFM